MSSKSSRKKFSNHLADQSSAYLLQHAHNPVDWYPWSAQALERAQTENKPILVSIGYSACHWCHVMEHESFENEDIAALMNENFINIKVDREERPDLDSLYMNAVQVMGGSGGWPLNVFLTPDAKPFLGGTYFPVQTAYGKPSWGQMLQHVIRIFSGRRDEVEKQAGQVLERIESMSEHIVRRHSSDAEPIEVGAGNASMDLSADNTQWAADTFENLRRYFDISHGGFGGAPKFPSSMSMQFLLRYSALSDQADVSSHALFSIEKMIRGGIYDQLGGGFARYSTDAEWKVPHFEKMLYDNGLLLNLLSEAQSHSPKKLFEQAIRQTVDFLHRDLGLECGAFAASLDADTEGEEGKYYIWSAKEVRDVLQKEDASLFTEFYGVSEQGNWEGNNILHQPYSIGEFAGRHQMSSGELIEKLSKSGALLLAHRSKRTPPGRDEKVVTSWNALAALGLLSASAVMKVDEWGINAGVCIDYLLNECRTSDGHLTRSIKGTVAGNRAFLDDYALLIAALIELYAFELNEARLHKAMELCETVLRDFSDDKDQYFYYSPLSQGDLILRNPEFHDGSTPSGNAVMCGNLQRLGVIFDRPEFSRRAAAMLDGLSHSVKSHPTSFGYWSNCMLQGIYGFDEIAVTGPNVEGNAKLIRSHYLPNLLLMGRNDQGPSPFPLLDKRGAHGNDLIYRCRNYSCEQPVKEVSELFVIKT